MSANRLITDLVVKRIKVFRKSGSSWVSATNSYPKQNENYKIQVYFGNANGMVAWEEELYRKDNVDVRVVAMGFYHNSHYYRKNEIVFYTNSSYTTPVSGDQFRTKFKFNEYKTNYADSVLEAYFKVKRDEPYKFSVLKWDNGVYGSVRNKHWKKIFTT